MAWFDLSTCLPNYSSLQLKPGLKNLTWYLYRELGQILLWILSMLNRETETWKSLSGPPEVGPKDQILGDPTSPTQQWFPTLKANSLLRNSTDGKKLSKLIRLDLCVFASEKQHSNQLVEHLMFDVHWKEMLLGVRYCMDFSMKWFRGDQETHQRDISSSACCCPSRRVPLCHPSCGDGPIFVTANMMCMRMASVAVESTENKTKNCECHVDKRMHKATLLVITNNACPVGS